MLSIIIADDFLPDRENIREVLLSLKPDDTEIAITGEFENGLQVMDYIADNKVDIIVTDIEMPFMDGLELAKKVRDVYPYIGIIFCSLYDNFDYVRKALYLDSYGYILKPVKREEIEISLKKIIRKRKEESQFIQDNRVFQDFLLRNKSNLLDGMIKDLVTGTLEYGNDIWDKFSYLEASIKAGLFMLVLLEIDDFDILTARMDLETKQVFSLKVFTEVKSITDGFDRCNVVKMNESRFIALLNFYSLVGKEEYEDAFKYAYSICKKIKNSFEESDISLTSALSGITGNILDLNKLYEECNYLIRYKYLMGKASIICREDTPEKIFNPAVNYNTILKELRFLLNSGDIKELEDFVDAVFKDMNPSYGEYYYVNLCFTLLACTQHTLNEHSESFGSVFGDEGLVFKELLQFDTIAASILWIKKVLVKINRYIAQRNCKSDTGIVARIKEHIQNNIDKDISLETIAGHLFYSPNYLNCIFKRETGGTIYDFISTCKVEKAKELLSNSNLKLNDISKFLGYGHTAYFGSVFKKFTGLTPRQYRERNVI